MKVSLQLALESSTTICKTEQRVKKILHAHLFFFNEKKNSLMTASFKFGTSPFVAQT